MGLPPSLPCMPRAVFLSLLVCILYGTVSMSLGLVNKVVLSSYKFECVFLLLSGQLLLLLLLCIVTRDYLGNPLGLPKYNTATHFESLPVGFAYVANVVVGLLGVSSGSLRSAKKLNRSASS